MRLIDADAVEEYLNVYVDPYEVPGALYAISKMPTIEPERKKGTWEVHNILDYAQRNTGRKIGKCPFCDYLTGEFRNRVDMYIKLTNYCPNCGAELWHRYERR